MSSARNPLVFSFSSANLFANLQNDYCSPNEVAANARAQYLYRYLNSLGAQTIVLEANYVDGDYLEDFSAYYVRCFQPYERTVKRLHFFKSDLTDDRLLHMVRGELTPEDVERVIRQEYLGFVVARPLPEAIVGRTVLGVPDPDHGRRHYPVRHACRANIFGIEFSLQSLPYQEQDQVLAACATVALWSALRQTASLFGAPAPRPAEITKFANAVGHRGRAIPSPGLSVEAICHSISHVGLEPEYIDCEGKPMPVASLVYAYLAACLPVIIIVEVGNRGLHAITLAGYSIRSARLRAEERVDALSTPPMTGLRIDKFYGHDDQVGPFARLTLVEESNGATTLRSDGWKDAGGKPEILTPHALIIPLYNKVRLTFIDIQRWLIRVTGVVQVILSSTSDFEWDVRLTTTNDFKREVSSSGLPVDEMDDLLLSSQPRFLWRATLSVRGCISLDLLFDATGIPDAFALHRVVWHDPAFKSAMRTLLDAPQAQGPLRDRLTPRFFDALRQSVR